MSGLGRPYGRPFFVRNSHLTMLERSSILHPMDKLDNTRRAAIVRALVDGASIRATARMWGADKDAVLRLLVRSGSFARSTKT